MLQNLEVSRNFQLHRSKNSKEAEILTDFTDLGAITREKFGGLTKKLYICSVKGEAK